MTNPYIAIGGERVDTLVFQYYGSIKKFESTLEANPHLLNNIILKQGDQVTFPDMEEESVVLPIKKEESNINIERIGDLTPPPTGEENIKSLW